MVFLNLQVQLIRIQVRVPEYGWTTQKVFHLLNAVVCLLRSGVFFFRPQLEFLSPEILKLLLLDLPGGDKRHSVTKVVRAERICLLDMFLIQTEDHSRIVTHLSGSAGLKKQMFAQLAMYGTLPCCTSACYVLPQTSSAQSV